MATDNGIGIIDSHTHPFGNSNVDLTDKIKSKRDAVTLRFRHPEAYREFWTNREDAGDLLIEDMNAAGISRTVVQPSVGEGNQGVINMIKRHPDRLVGLFNVGDPELVTKHPTDGRPVRAYQGRPTQETQAEFAAEVKHYVEDIGLKGCGEILGFTKHSAPELIAEDLTPLLEVLSDYRLPLQIPTGWSQFPTALYHGVPFFVDDLAERFPEVPIIITKMGRGYSFIFEVALAVAFKHYNVYLDTVQAPAEHIARAVSELGADRVLYGTDWSMSWRQANMPNGIYNNTLAVIEDASLSAADKEWVLGKTCASVFGI